MTRNNGFENTQIEAEQEKNNNNRYYIKDLKRSGRQRQGRLRLKNEFLPLLRI